MDSKESEEDIMFVDDFPGPIPEKKSEFGLLPVRCMTCNKVIGHLQNHIENDISNNVPYAEIFDKYKLVRYCCRKNIYTINVIDEYGKYGELPSTVKLGEWKKGTRIYYAR